MIEDDTKTTLPKEHYYTPNEMYEVYLWFNYNIDLDDEYPCENIELIDGRAGSHTSPLLNGQDGL